MEQWTVIELEGELFEIRPYKKPRKAYEVSPEKQAAIDRNHEFLQRLVDTAKDIYNNQGYKAAGVGWKQCVKLAGEMLRGQLNA